MKQKCHDCGKELNEETGYLLKSGDRAGLFYSYCKDCQKLKAKEGRDPEEWSKRKDKRNAARREKYRSDAAFRDKIQSWSREYKRKNKTRTKEYMKQRRLSLWLKAIEFFGPCSCCGENRIEFLAIDHIHGNGNKERKAGKPSGGVLLSRFETMGWPDKLKEEYRLLCHNCNMAIAFYGYCPHKD